MSTTLAYLAGFFDGEGSLGFWRSGRGYRHFRMGMCNTNREILDLFQAVLGGSIVHKPLGKLGRKQQWHWSVCGDAAWDAYYKLEPYLREKRWKQEPKG